MADDERNITSGEIELLKKNCPSVGVPVDWENTRFNPNDGPRTVTTGRLIRLENSLWSEKDISAPGVSVVDKAVLIHEGVHRWQRMQWGYVTYMSRGAAEGGKGYRYRLSDLTKPDAFNNLGMEQQAAVVEDYYRLRNGVAAGEADEVIPLSAYTNILAPLGIKN